MGFNPRVRGGRDMCNWWHRLNECEFQSARPRGTRSVPTVKWSPLPLFQSARPRGTRFPYIKPFQFTLRVSIRASAGDAMRGWRDVRINDSVSIRASAGDAIETGWMRHTAFLVSIRASAGDAMQSMRRGSMISGMFQSARPRGTRSGKALSTSRGFLRFNPRVRGGRDSPSGHSHDSPSSFNPRVRGGRDMTL